MRVLCDNCGTTYKIPDHKLSREVNRATCKKCGHLMVIRVAPTIAAAPAQQPVGEQEEERTLVTSLAEVERRARDVAAAAGQLEPNTARVQPVEETEETESAALYYGEAQPSPAPPALMRSVPPAPLVMPAPPPIDDDLSDALSPDADQATQEEPAPPPLPPPTRAPARAAPPPAASAPVPHPVAPAAVAPSQPSATRPTSKPAHDPSGDLTMVLMGSLLGIGGALILAFNLHGNPVLRFLGLVVALLGSLASLLVVLTSNRGRKPAGVVLSLFLSTFLAVAIAGAAYVIIPSSQGPTLIGELARALTEGAPTRPPEPAAAPPPVEVSAAPVAPVAPIEPPAPVEPPAAPEATGLDSKLDSLLATTPAAATPTTTPPVATTATTPTTTAAPTPTAPASTTQPKAPTAPASTTTARTSTPSSSATPTTTTPSATSSRTSSTPSSTSSRTTSTPSSTSSRTSSTPSSTSTSAPTSTASAPASTPKSTLNTTVVDTMLRSNSGVKKCFGEEKKRAGSLPTKITVKLQIMPTGRVSSAAVKEAAFAGSELDGCLSDAIKAIQFPPFEGDPMGMSYPFILQ